eukprot:m.1210841 g.1210841  ORF g.1210841 m.1210841 type:complete len:130 (+) comp24593_c1_seq4:177-566(+)
MLVAKLVPKDWISLSQSCKSITLIAQFCQQSQLDAPLFINILDVYEPAVSELVNLIERLCNFEVSVAEGRFVVNAFVDESLDEQKSTYLRLPEILTEVSCHRQIALIDDDIADERSSSVNQSNILFTCR